MGKLKKGFVIIEPPSKLEAVAKEGDWKYENLTKTQISNSLNDINNADRIELSAKMISAGNEILKYLPKGYRVEVYVKKVWRD
ncbi:MAG: hypothetical protein AABY32_04735 [Nanoarchaeota archaeon]